MQFRRLLAACLGASMFCSVLNAQQPASTQSVVVPRLVNFAGKAVDAQGKIIAGIAGATFAIYKDQYEGSPLWLETQNIQADAKGNFTAQLGTTKPEGLPLELFTSGEARWLGVTINNATEQPRILLLSVPYALKAADAETIGGLPASAFVLANKPQTNAGSAKAETQPSANTAVPPANPAVTGKGVVDFIPMWDTTSDIKDSIMFQKSSQIGVNTRSPAATLDVNGKTDVRNTLTLFPSGTNSTLAVNGTAFNVDQTGKVTFISSQTFPGTGTVTNVAAGTDLTGGGTSGKVTLNLDTTKVPQLNASNVFTVEQFVQAPRAGLNVFATTNPGGPIAQLGSNGTTDSSSVQIYSGSGTAETFVAGCAGCFVPGALPGDGGLRVESGKNLVLGDVGLTRMTLDSAGNAAQPRSAGGFVKAMLNVNGSYPPYSIVSCFNSALSGAAATTPPCGINFTEVGSGYWNFDFGYTVSDRFFSATLIGGTTFATNITVYPWTTTQVQVLTSDSNFNGLGAQFWLIVY